MGDLADWYVRCRVGNSEEQTTDTHLRAQRGKASWNWRFKFGLTFDIAMKNQRLSLQLMDWDIGGEMFGANDSGGEAQLSLTPWFKSVFRRAGTKPEYWEPASSLKRQCDEEGSGLSSLSEVAESFFTGGQSLLIEGDQELEKAKFWLPLVRTKGEDGERPKGYDGKNPPELLLSVQLVPECRLPELEAGSGRSEPNTNPVLPKPVGRLQFTINPFAMCFRLLGPRLCNRLMRVFCLLLCILMLYYMLPVVFTNVLTVPVLSG